MKTTSHTLLSLVLPALLGWLAAVQPAGAQAVPELLNYQGVLRQGDGTPAPAGYKDIEFRIYDAATGGNVLWGRTHRVHLDSNGLFNVVLMEGGSPITAGSPRYSDLTSVFTSAGSQDRYLELTVVGSTPIMPRQQFVTTAFAFLAGDVAQAKQNFTVQGALTVQAGAHVQTLTVDQNTTVGGSLTVATNLTVGSTLTAGDKLTANRDAEVKGNLVVDQTATVQGLTTLRDALVVTGHASVASQGAAAVLAGGYPSPDSGRLMVGDGTGWKFHFTKQSGGTNTDLLSIQDNGNLMVKGGPPFVLRTFSPGSWTPLDTGVPTNNWVAMVVGSQSDGDFNEDDSGLLLHMHTVAASNGNWWICYGVRNDSIYDIYVEVLFIRREWTEDIRSFNH